MNKNNRNSSVLTSVVITALGLLGAAVLLAFIKSSTGLMLGGLPTLLICLLCGGIAAGAYNLIKRKNAPSEPAVRTPKAPKKADHTEQYRGMAENLVAALFASLMVSYIYQLLSNGGFEDLSAYINSIKMGWFIVIAVLSFAVIIGATILLKKRCIIPWALMISAMAASVLLVLNASEISAYFAVGVGLVDFIVILWVARGDKLEISKISISRKAALIVACVLFVITTFTFGYITSLKYRSYSNFTFDFGIFAQMYERMACTLEPNTTVERSFMMSHYGVHFSPIFYLFLPGYYIFRTPIYLFFVQSASIAAGIFAVYLIAGKLGLSGKMTVALEVIYAFYPCLFNGTFYDFHENKFLTTIILFLFYFILKKNTLCTFLFSLMLLMVKEDAAIYLIVIALYVAINRKEVWKGLSMLLLAVVYFLIAQEIVKNSGPEGVMMSRLSDYFINGEASFGSVAKAVSLDAGYLIKQMFTVEKIPFILWMFAPVLFTPFMTKKVSSLILLLPIIPINLMQSWKYQYDVDYQYTYGVAALIIFSAIMAMAALKGGKKRVVVLTAMCMCIIMSLSLVAPKVKNVTKYAQSNEKSASQVDELIESVPADATVTAAHALVPHLYKVEWLYTMPDYYGKYRDKPVDTDYFVIDTRYSDLASSMKEVMGDKYDLIKKAGFAELYKHK